MIRFSSAGPPAAARGLRALVDPLDRWANRLYGAEFNPLYQSGTLAILFFLVSTVTGLYLFLFYKIASPYESVLALERQVVLGQWTHSVHRLSADLAIVATAVHVVRKLIQGHTWGPRALAWLSGLFLLAITLLCGWTGLVMVWDAQGQRLAIAGAKLMDLLPFLSLPLERAFDGSAPVPSSFFFMNLFLHVALPLGVALIVWVHLSRLSRPKLLPPRRLWVSALLLVAAVAAVAPAGLGAAADLRALPGRAPLDLFYAFWLPAAERFGPAANATAWLGGFALLALAPWLWRPRRPRHAIGTSSVDEGHCTGCTTCYLDCPYEAIAMVKRSDFSVQRSELVARVDPSRCVGCGICSASCAPMGVGPAGRTGRDQLAWARDVAAPSGRREVWVLACRTGIDPGLSLPDGVALEGVNCGGAVHTAVIERLLRDSAAGVLVVTCPPRNCSFREGPKWAQARLFEGREADLSPRVDRRRVRLVGLAAGDARGLRREIADFRAYLATVEAQPAGDFDLLALCERAADREVEEMADVARV